VFPYLASHGKLQKYCSEECFYKATAPKFITATCQSCGQEFTYRYHPRNHGKARAGEERKYCSKKCMGAAYAKIRKGAGNPVWAGGKSLARRRAHKVILQAVRSIGKCEECGSTSQLQGHHVIPVCVNPDLVDDPRNIKVLCLDCHAKQHPDMHFFFAWNKTRETRGT
jgi:hypothetical protein